MGHAEDVIICLIVKKFWSHDDSVIFSRASKQVDSGLDLKR
jgi:hypothetical protein